MVRQGGICILIWIDGRLTDEQECGLHLRTNKKNTGSHHMRCPIEAFGVRRAVSSFPQPPEFGEDSVFPWRRPKKKRASA